VYSHVRIADRQDAIHAARIATGEANALIGGDLVVSVAAEALARLRAGLTRAVVNSAQQITGEFVARPEAPSPPPRWRRDPLCGAERADFLDRRGSRMRSSGTRRGEHAPARCAWQKGLVPLAADSILRAVELNTWQSREQGGVRLGTPRLSIWRRREAAGTRGCCVSLDDSWRRARGCRLSGRGHARRKTALVEAVRQAEGARWQPPPATEAVARAYFRLLASRTSTRWRGVHRRALPRGARRRVRGRVHIGSIRAARRPASAFGRSPCRAPSRPNEATARQGARSVRPPRAPAERALRAEYRPPSRVAPALTPDNHATAVEIAGCPSASAASAR
jgi:hypothetical protein